MFIPTRLSLAVGLAASLSLVPPCIAQDQPGFPVFSFWTVGSGGWRDRFDTDLYEVLDRDREDLGLILSAIASQPLGEARLLNATGLERDRVRALTADLQRNQLIRRTSAGLWATTVPVVTNEQMPGLRRTLAPLAHSVAQQIGNNLPQLMERYRDLKAPTDPPWNGFSHRRTGEYPPDLGMG